MKIAYAFAAAFLLAIHIGIGIKIALELKKRNVKIDWWFIRFKIFGYVKQYRLMLQEETGVVPPLHTGFVVSGVIVIIVVVVGLIIFH